MCPVCLATIGLYVAGGVSAGGITTYLATRSRRRPRDQHVGWKRTNDGKPPKEGEKRDDEAHDRDT
jgi:hypothetical protein